LHALRSWVVWSANMPHQHEEQIAGEYRNDDGCEPHVVIVASHSRAAIGGCREQAERAS
jgi:hypothetical protein